MFKPKDSLDRLFEIGIILKGVDGVAELVGGLLLLFVTPADIHHLAAVLTQGELSEDPNDVVARYLLHTANGLTGNAVIFGAVYLLVHGAVKVGLVVALLLNKLWAYPSMIIILLIFIGYQLYRIALGPKCWSDCADGVRRADCCTDLAGVWPAAPDPARSSADCRDR